MWRLEGASKMNGGSLNDNLWFAYKKLQPLLIQNFVVAEGAHFTLPEVDTILSGARVRGKDEFDMLILENTITAFRLFNNMMKSWVFDIRDKSVFLKLHACVANKEALEWGKFRTGQVWINGTDYIPPDSAELIDKFNELSEFMLDKNLSELEKAILFHIKAAKIQFFYDGNKRTSRIMSYGHLLQNGFMPYSLEEDILVDYNTYMLEYYNTDDCTKVLELLKQQQNKWQKRYESL
jgi:Fic family protein